MKLMEKEAEIRDRIIETNNQWNSELEYIAASIGEKCIGFKWMHAQCATFYSFCYHIIGLIVILGKKLNSSQKKIFLGKILRFF